MGGEICRDSTDLTWAERDDYIVRDDYSRIRHGAPAAYSRFKIT